MSGGKKISFYQTGAMLAASRLFCEAMNFPFEYGMQRFSVILISYIIVFILYIPLMIIGKKYSGESAFGLIRERSGALGVIFGLFISVLMIFTAVFAVNKLSFYSSSTIFGEASSALLIILTLTVCGYSCFKGIQACARSGVIYSFVFIAFIVLICASVWRRYDWQWLYPAFIEEPDKFLYQVMEQVGDNTEIIAFAVLMEHISEKANKTVYFYLPLVFLFAELSFLAETLVLGPYLSSVTFPLFTVSALSDIVLFQRLDGIDATVWTLLCIVKVNLAVLSVKTIFTRLIGKRSGLAAGGISLLLILTISLAFSGSADFAALINGAFATCIPVLVGAVLMPAIALILAGRKKPKNQIRR